MLRGLVYCFRRISAFFLLDFNTSLRLFNLVQVLIELWFKLSFGFVSFLSSFYSLCSVNLFKLSIGYPRSFCFLIMHVRMKGLFR